MVDNERASQRQTLREGGPDMRKYDKPITIFLFIIIPLGFAWYESPPTIRQHLYITTTAAAIYCSLLILDKLFSFEGRAGRGFMTLLLLIPTAELLDGSKDLFPVAAIIVYIAVYVLCRFLLRRRSRRAPAENGR